MCFAIKLSEDSVKNLRKLLVFVVVLFAVVLNPAVRGASMSSSAGQSTIYLPLVIDGSWQATDPVSPLPPTPGATATPVPSATATTTPVPSATASPSPTSSPSSGLPWLKTSGNQIVTESGQPVTLRGANIMRSE